MKFNKINRKVIKWASDKNLVHSENVEGQALKFIEESGELCGAILRDDRLGMIDGIGDVYVTLAILAAQLGLDPVDCYESAWHTIKDRRGHVRDGIFIKEA